MTYVVTVDDGDALFDLRCGDDEIVATVDRLLLKEGHDKVLARRVDDD